MPAWARITVYIVALIVGPLVVGSGILTESAVAELVAALGMVLVPGLALAYVPTSGPRPAEGNPNSDHGNPTNTDTGGGRHRA